MAVDKNKKTDVATVTPEEKAAEEARQQYIVERAKTLAGTPEPELKYDVPEPDKDEYIKGQEWYNTYFPTMTREEEQKRERKALQAHRWQLWTNAASAIVNAIGGSYGGRTLTIPEAKFPDLQTWRNQLNSDRKARAAQEMADRKAYSTAYATWQQGKNTVDKYNMQNRQKYLKTLEDYTKMLSGQEFKAEQAEEALKGKKDLQTQKHGNTMAEIAKRNEGHVGSGSGGRAASNKDRYEKMDKTSLTNEFESRKSNMPYADRKAKTPAAMAAALRRLDYQQGKTRTTSSSGASSSSSGGGSGTTKRTTAVGNLRSKLNKNKK